MPYIGHGVTNAGTFYILDDLTMSSSTTYTMQVGGVSVTPKADNLLITLDGVIQHTPDAYTVSGSTITFDSAPGSGVDFYGIIMGQSATIGQGSIGADELKVTGDGSSGQVLASDGDGTFTWTTDTENYLPLAGGTMSGAINLGSQNVTNGGTITGTFVGNITGNVTGNTSGTAATVTGASQSAITSVGTLSSLLVASGGSAKPLQIGSNLVIQDVVGTQTMFANNAHYNGAWKQLADGENPVAMRFGAAGTINFHIAAEDAADATLSTWDTTDIKLSIAASGNVGVGTTSPVANLEIEDGGTSNSILCKITADDQSPYSLMIGNDTYSATDANGFGINQENDGKVRLWNAGSGVMAITAAGTVGIATTSPGAILDARATAASSWQAIHTYGQNKFYTSTNDSSELRFQFDMGGSSDPASMNLYGADGSTVAVHLDAGNDSYFNGGKVGIGEPNPGVTLHIRKDQNAETSMYIQNATGGTASKASLRLYSNSALGLITCQDTSYTTSGVYVADAMSVFAASTASGGLVLGTEGDHPVMFYQNNAEKMRISSGQLGIGGTPNASSLNIFADMDNTSSWGIRFDSTVTSGTAYMLQFRDGNEHECGKITINTGTDAASYTSGSDYRIKTNVEKMTGSIERLEKIKPYKYNAKKNAEGIKLDGFYAHELAEIIPEAVVGEKDAVDEDGEMIIQGIDYGRITPLLVSALQEAIERIKVLESK